VLAAFTSRREGVGFARAVAGGLGLGVRWIVAFLPQEASFGWKARRTSGELRLVARENSRPPEPTSADSGRH
jgi:hypothetical protein